MPTVNIFNSEERFNDKLAALSDKLKNYIAQQLTCGDISLKPDEVSVRIIKSNGVGMIAPVELEITAHAFKERVEKQDEICLNVMEFIKSQEQSLGDVRVWLILCELGHSWK